MGQGAMGATTRMEAALRVTTLVLSGGRVEVTNTQLPTGTPVDVIILFPEARDAMRRSVEDVLAEAPGHLAFQNADEVDAYLREERESWDH